MFAVIKLFQELFSPNRILRIISIHGNSNVPSTKKEKKKKKKKKRRKKGENKRNKEERRPVASCRGSFLEPLNDGRRGSKLPIRAR